MTNQNSMQIRVTGAERGKTGVMRASHGCFWLLFSLVEKMARVLLTNHRAL